VTLEISPLNHRILTSIAGLKGRWMSLSRSQSGCESAIKCIRETSWRSTKVNNRHQQRTLFTRIPHQTSQCWTPVCHRKRRRIHPPASASSTLLPHIVSFSTSTVLHDPADGSSFAGPGSSTLPWPNHPNPTPYEIFNIPRTASQKEIKSRYFMLVKQYHPDHAPKSSTERFRKVVEAYKVLSHPTKRQEWDTQNPDTSYFGTQRHSEFRQPWSGSRLSRRKTEAKGPPPSGGWSFHHPSRARPHVTPDYSQMPPSDADNAHFSYEQHYRRNLEQEMKIKRRLDELHAHRKEYERQRDRDSQTAKVAFAFTGGLFLCMVMLARSIYPS
jgi:hypothetical protein